MAFNSFSITYIILYIYIYIYICIYFTYKLEAYGLQGPESFLYTSRSGCLDVDGMDDVREYNETVVSLIVKTFSSMKKTNKKICINAKKNVVGYIFFNIYRKQWMWLDLKNMNKMKSLKCWLSYYGWVTFCS